MAPVNSSVILPPPGEDFGEAERRGKRVEGGQSLRVVKREVGVEEREGLKVALERDERRREATSEKT